MGNLKYRSMVWIRRQLCQDSVIPQDACSPIPLFICMMNQQVSWGRYAVYITWLDQQFPSKRHIVFRYLKRDYPTWMYSYHYLVGQYLLYHVTKAVWFLYRSLRTRIIRRCKCVRQSKQDFPSPSETTIGTASELYRLHKPRRRRFPTLPTKVFSINEKFVMDLVDLQTLAKYNKGYKYLLTVIDVLWKYAWVEPLKSKSATALVEALERPFFQAWRSSWLGGGRLEPNVENHNVSLFYGEKHVELY